MHGLRADIETQWMHAHRSELLPPLNRRRHPAVEPLPDLPGDRLRPAVAADPHSRRIERGEPGSALTDACGPLPGPEKPGFRPAAGQLPLGPPEGGLPALCRHRPRGDGAAGAAERPPRIPELHPAGALCAGDRRTARRDGYTGDTDGAGDAGQVSRALIPSPGRTPARRPATP